jgi:4-amino-4-deoxy-L-arabinose transferase-like glycosyltransferase
MSRPASPPMSSSAARDRWILAVVQLAVLLPFLGKAVHIDDAFFLAIARHITAAPFDPFGFDYNWAGTPAPVWQEMKNPPGVFYLQAALLQLGGESERWLHLAFWPFAFCTTQASYELARRVTREPLYPALLLALCPAFWVSATSLMIDTPLVAAMTLAVLGLAVAQEHDRWRPRIGAAVAASAAVLAKYFGLAVVPLLAAQLALQRPRRARDALVVLLPLLAFAAWWAVSDGHVMQAVAYRSDERADLAVWLVTHGLSGATFTAGLLGFPVALFAAALFDSERRGMALIALAVGIGGALALASWRPTAGLLDPLLALVLVASAVAFVWESFSKLPSGALQRVLLLWLAGALVFACLVNWTLNARTILLLAPPAVLIFAWQSEGRRVRRAGALLLTGLIGAAVVAADAELAEFGRGEARRVVQTMGAERVRFVGHWGFQYYMERAGFEHVDLASPDLRAGDVVVAPVMHQIANGGIAELRGARERTVELRARRIPLAVMDPGTSAGLHGAFVGALPFSLTMAPLERVEVLRW